MLNVLRNRTFARLFAAQVIALVGTGLLTVALGLLAFDLAGARAGVVLGTAYAIKMIAYVGLSPIAHAIVERLPRKTVLVGADIIRGSIALFLPFVTEIWQIYLLIFVLQSASATFTPSFQAAIPDILTGEKDYTNALSLSRLAYDIENIVSPVLAGMLLAVVSYHWLFGGTVVGFVGSACLVLLARLPVQIHTKSRPFSERLTRGARIYLSTPRLRGLLALNFSAAAVSAFVLVNTVVMVRAVYGLSDLHLAYALAAYGGGSMVAALALPRLLESITDRSVMLSSAYLLAFLTVVHGVFFLISGPIAWGVFLAIWGLSGMLYSAILTPAGRLLRHSAHAQDRSAIFAAHFALSHACWLVTYPVAGYVGAAFGLPVALLSLGAFAMIGIFVAKFVWRPHEFKELVHEHPNLPPEHPHIAKYHTTKIRHRHVFVIDDEHKVWPTQG